MHTEYNVNLLKQLVIWFSFAIFVFQGFVISNSIANNLKDGPLHHLLGKDWLIKSLRIKK